MSISLFDLYSIGIGPSSSHTVGPMRAAKEFAFRLKSHRKLHATQSIKIELFGSLAMTGIGHGTDKALLLGLEGYTPEGIEVVSIEPTLNKIASQSEINLIQQKKIFFQKDQHLLFQKGKRLPYHSNAMRFCSYDHLGKEIAKEVFYSVGGGFIISQSELHRKKKTAEVNFVVPYPFATYKELEHYCLLEGKSIAEIMLENELALDTLSNIHAGIFQLWQVMKQSIKRGCETDGILPGGLEVKRRAARLWRELSLNEKQGVNDPAAVFDWVSVFALAVNEENAAGGKVVTAPTNGAAGVIPAVLHYYEKFIPSFSKEGIITFFLTSAAIGILFKHGASLSAAEMGCQGEIGVASAMAAAGLTAALGGSNDQIENAAEIAMEHHLGLTCDPIGGLVQVPCIERNTMGAIKAINASRLALKGKGDHKVRLDEVIKAMNDVGRDMHAKYKETSTGGLATHVPVSNVEC